MRLDPNLVASLPRSISNARLSPYMARYKGDQTYAIRLYAWNIEVSAAFWGPLCMLEIALRNSMHDTMANGRIPKWWEIQTVHLADRSEKLLKLALEKLEKNGNLSPTADDIVAATSLGFWVGLLDVGVARHSLLDYETALWRPRLNKAFPNRGALERKQVHSKLDRIRKFRNRIAHHEPIFGAGLLEMHNLIIECIGLVDEGVAIYVKESQRVDRVIEGQQSAVSMGTCSF